MSARKSSRVRTRVVGSNPLEGEQLLLDALYGKSSAPRRPQRAERVKPQHYKVISISMYNEDIERLEQLVKELKRRGHYKANKSQVIRQALAQLDVGDIAPEHS